ncbi:hypothetical protein HIDPHFAB_04090 [Nocardioides sp. T2.26MG-1]|nr:hypothetical protein HIDPHFAB_04090 [Nocardioides sp. T2.26MG-1]
MAYGVATDDGPQDGGRYSALTRSQLASTIERGARQDPLLLPAQLPPGADEEDEPGFFLPSNPIPGANRDGTGKMWMTLYSVDALPPAFGNVTGYLVYQDWMGAPGRHRARCNRHDTQQGVLVRKVGDDRVTVCLGPHPTAAARDYWRTVGFTDDLGDVEWLRDGAD